MLGSLGSQDVSLLLSSHNVQKRYAESNAALVEHSPECGCGCSMDDALFVREAEECISDSNCGQRVDKT